MVLVQAPWGYGKTTLLSEWSEATQRDVCWLTLTGYDRPPERLLDGVLTTIERHLRDSASAVGDVMAVMAHLRGQGQPVELIARTLGEALQQAERSVVVVIDRAELATSEGMRDALTPLVVHGGGAIRMVMASTSEVRPDLWRLTAHDLELIGATDLAFNEAEIDAVLAHDRDLVHPGASEAETGRAAEILALTQGWPVAVALLQRARERGERDEPNWPVAPVDDQSVTEYVQALVEDLPPDLRDFILASTTTPTLNGDLARALTGREDAAAVLERGATSGLFLDRTVKRDGQTVYTWHALFARHARIIASRRSPERAAANERAAARWLRTDFPEEAVQHAVRGGDLELALAILRDNWFAMIVDGRSLPLEECCARLPDEVREQPEVLVIRSCCRELAGDRDTAMLLRDRAARRHGSAQHQDEEVERASILASLFLGDDPDRLVRAVDRVAALVDAHVLPERAHLYVTFLAGWVVLRLRTSPDKAIRLLRTAYAQASSLGHTRLAERARQNLRFVLTWAGSFRAADEVPQTGTPMPHSPWDGYDGEIDTVTAMYSAYWRDDLDEVIERGTALLTSPIASGYSAIGLMYYGFGVAASRRSDLVDGARRALTRVPPNGSHGVPWPIYRRVALAVLAESVGEVERAQEHARAVVEASDVPASLAVAIDVLRRTGDRAGALRGLALLSKETPIYVRTMGICAQAALAWETGERSLAHRSLEQALVLAEPEGIRRPFAGADPVLQALMAAHGPWGTAYEPLLADCLGRTTSVPVSRRHVDPLTVREREVLAHLRTTMTAAEIAQALFVSVATVRTHMRAIYRKLGVPNRREAARLLL